MPMKSENPNPESRTMSIIHFVVTSAVHGDFAGFADKAMANAAAQRLNSRMWDVLVYRPLAAVEFVVSMEQEADLNRRYTAEAFDVVRVIEVK